MQRAVTSSGEEGFTLIELVIVVAILAVLVMISIASYSGSTATVRAITCGANQKVLQEAINAYSTVSTGTTPPDIEALADYVNELDAARQCPNGDGTLLEYDPVTATISCPNHP